MSKISYSENVTETSWAHFCIECFLYIIDMNSELTLNSYQFGKIFLKRGIFFSSWEKLTASAASVYNYDRVCFFVRVFVVKCGSTVATQRCNTDVFYFLNCFSVSCPRNSYVVFRISFLVCFKFFY